MHNPLSIAVEIIGRACKQRRAPSAAARSHRRRATLPALIALSLWLSGCGGGQSQPGTDGSAQSASPPPASLDERPATAEPEPQGPAALIAEIARLRTLPDTVIEVTYENGTKREENRRAPTPEEIATEQQRRLEKTIELASIVIKDVHADPSQEQILNNAVHYLCDARLQLALMGHAEQAQQLSQDAQALFERDPTSFAAVEAGYKVVQLAESMAARFGAQNRDWVHEYAAQARLFADRFPQEQGRAAVALIAAGRKCEQFQMLPEARQCYLQVEQQYPDSAFTMQIAGILRRLRLEGQPIELAGPTIDGGFFSLEKFGGRPILVIFWSAGSETLRRDLPVLKQIAETWKEDQLTIVGINLDEQESAVEAFLEETGVNWRQIFYSDPAQRGGRNPWARYYGIHVTPTYWLVDAKGTVVAAPAPIEQLRGRIEQLVSDTPVSTEPESQPDSTPE